MEDEKRGWFPAELSRLIDEALQRQINHRRSVEAWAQQRKDGDTSSMERDC